MVNCPKCSGRAVKGGVSRYWCESCRQWWLIQPLSSYPPPTSAVPPKVVKKNE